MLLQLFDENGSLLVLAALVLEPDTNHSRAKSGHLDQLVLHQCVGSRVGRVARPQRVKLFLVQHRPYTRRLCRAAAPRGHVTRRRTTSASGCVFLCVAADASCLRVTCSPVFTASPMYGHPSVETITARTQEYSRLLFTTYTSLSGFCRVCGSLTPST